MGLGLGLAWWCGVGNWLLGFWGWRVGLGGLWDGVWALGYGVSGWFFWADLLGLSGS
jgi:hypothetical protein